MPIKELCRKGGFSDATFYKWRAKFGGMDVSDAKRLKELEGENKRLKTLLAEAELARIPTRHTANDRLCVRMRRTNWLYPSGDGSGLAATSRDSPKTNPQTCTPPLQWGSAARNPCPVASRRCPLSWFSGNWNSGTVEVASLGLVVSPSAGVV